MLNVFPTLLEANTLAPFSRPRSRLNNASLKLQHPRFWCSGRMVHLFTANYCLCFVNNPTMNPGLSISASVLTEGNRPYQNIISGHPASNIWSFHHLCPSDLPPCLTVSVYLCCICAVMCAAILVFFYIKQHRTPEFKKMQNTKHQLLFKLHNAAILCLLSDSSFPLCSLQDCTPLLWQPIISFLPPLVIGCHLLLSFFVSPPCWCKPYCLPPIWVNNRLMVPPYTAASRTLIWFLSSAPHGEEWSRCSFPKVQKLPEI